MLYAIHFPLLHLDEKCKEEEEKQTRSRREREAKQHERELFHYILVICDAVFLTACKLENWHTRTHTHTEKLNNCTAACVCVWKAKEIRKQTGWQPDLAFICGLIKRKLVTMQRCLFKVFAAAARKSH